MYNCLAGAFLLHDVHGKPVDYFVIYWKLSVFKYFFSFSLWKYLVLDLLALF